MPSARGHHQRYKWPWWGVGSPGQLHPGGLPEGLVQSDGPWGWHRCFHGGSEDAEPRAGRPGWSSPAQCWL